MDLKLSVNYLPLDLGIPIDKEKMLASGFKKPNWISKAGMLAAPWAPILFAKAPALAFFIGQDATQTRSVATSEAFAIIEGRLQLLYIYLTYWTGTLQVFQANLLRDPNSDVYTDWFANVAHAHLGAPAFETPKARVWQDRNSELVATKDRFYLRWAADPWRAFKGRR